MSIRKWVAAALLAVGAIGIQVPTSVGAGTIAFTSDRDGNLNIYRMNMDGTNQVRLTDGPGDSSSPVFSPDGRSIAFMSNRSGSNRIYAMRWDGSNLKEIPDSGCYWFYLPTRGVAWSPDGTKLLFRPTHDSVATVDLDGSHKTTLFTGGVQGHDLVSSIDWGPTVDDIYLSAQVYSWGYDQHVFHYSISSGVFTQITQDAPSTPSIAPNASPNGSEIVFHRQADWSGKYNIFTKNLATGTESQLTFDSGFSFGPRWVGAGNEIAYTSDRSGTCQTWLMDSTGGNLRMLEGPGNNYQPTWSAIFPTNQNPIADAGADQTVAASGTLTQVTLDGSNSSDPDGDQLTFEWSIPGVQPSPTGATVTAFFPVGPTLVTLTVTDGRGGVATDDVLITVKDETPPVVVCMTKNSVLWPPNHQVEQVAVYVQASDALTNPNQLTVAATVSSNEPDDALGDGHFTGDVNGKDGYTQPVPFNLTFDANLGWYVGTLALRAERDGSQGSRVYSIVCNVTDEAGNKTTASCVVVVPHDRRKN